MKLILGNKGFLFTKTEGTNPTTGTGKNPLEMGEKMVKKIWPIKINWPIYKIVKKSF